ncbi:hypothetical protein PV325_011946 [Microctonus aethiopoides]|nr:hypothetical protein PV325_011946 [Microctonus aethiopoides]
MDEIKNVHYSESEKLLLAQLISEESAIGCKKTGAVDLKQKGEAWERVTKKFVSEGYTPRTTKQLKKCWDNLKQKKRKSTTIMKHQRLMTGGGPAPVERADPVMDFIDETTGNIDVEIHCPFDSTAGFEKDYDMGFLDESLTVLDEDKDICSETVVSHPGNQSHRSSYQASTSKKKETWSHTNLKDQGGDIYSDTVLSHPGNQSNKQVPSQLASSSKKKGTSSHENLKNISDERELRLIRLREAIEQQRELHAKKMQIAAAEEKIAILNILKLEEQLQ